MEPSPAWVGPNAAAAWSGRDNSPPWRSCS